MNLGHTNNDWLVQGLVNCIDIFQLTEKRQWPKRQTAATTNSPKQATATVQSMSPAPYCPDLALGKQHPPLRFVKIQTHEPITTQKFF